MSEKLVRNKMDSTKLESESIIVEAPFSFTGATKRIWRVVENTEDPRIKAFVVIPIVVMTLMVVYAGIVMWYIMFGLLLVPFRLIRRSQRNKKLQKAQHKEMLEVMRSMQKS
jgi:hypothetical protein